MENRETEELYARLDDLKERADRGDVGISAFLTPRELHYAESYLGRKKIDFLSFGGYDDAERKMVYILPEYMEGVDNTDALTEYGYSTNISVLEAKGSGFEKLSHRTFMGSLLGLGLERSVIGDIVMTDEHTALVFCDSSIAEFLLASWQKAGRDKIKLSKVCLPKGFAPSRKYAPINDTVASPRLDCVVGALCSLSREKARVAVESGTVELDYECEERADREVRTPCLISVRGYGKFKVLSLEDKTKKGRYRLVGEKFL
jgi:RNA-binding protein YlmH